MPGNRAITQQDTLVRNPVNELVELQRTPRTQPRAPEHHLTSPAPSQMPIGARVRVGAGRAASERGLFNGTHAGTRLVRSREQDPASANTGRHEPTRRKSGTVWHVCGTPVSSRRSPGPAQCCDQGFRGGRDRRRSGDPALFRRVLCRLSYPASRRPPPRRRSSAVLTGFEPAASALTGRRALQTAPQDQMSRRQVSHCGADGAPRGVRIPVTALKGRRPGPLDDGGSASPEAAHRSSTTPTLYRFRGSQRDRGERDRSSTRRQPRPPQRRSWAMRWARTRSVAGRVPARLVISSGSVRRS